MAHVQTPSFRRTYRHHIDSCRDYGSSLSYKQRAEPQSQRKIRKQCAGNCTLFRAYMITFEWKLQHVAYTQLCGVTFGTIRTTSMFEHRTLGACSYSCVAVVTGASLGWSIVDYLTLSKSSSADSYIVTARTFSIMSPPIKTKYAAENRPL